MNLDHDVLITIAGFGATWDGASNEMPWNVYVTKNGHPVLQGGPYPDGNKVSRLIAEKLGGDIAFSIAKRLENVFTEFGMKCKIEELADL